MPGCLSPRSLQARCFNVAHVLIIGSYHSGRILSVLLVGNGLLKVFRRRRTLCG